MRPARLEHAKKLAFILQLSAQNSMNHSSSTRRGSVVSLCAEHDSLSYLSENGAHPGVDLSGFVFILRFYL
jgi:hypothetical protein